MSKYIAIYPDYLVYGLLTISDNIYSFLLL